MKKKPTAAKVKAPASRLAKAFKRGWRPPDRRPPWMWAEEHICLDKTSPFPGKWRSETSPWVREVMEVFADNQVKDITVVCSAQSSKTQTIMCLLAWAIAEDPGPCMWVTAAQDEAKTFARTRLMPTLEDCPPVAALFPENRFEKSTLEINFATMPLIINGANSQSKLQSKPVRWLFLDEVRNYPPGALEMVKKRVTAWWNSRIVIISTPHKERDAVDLSFLAGDQRYFHVKCEACGEASPLSWANMKWDSTEATCPDGVWNFDALAETIRYECPKCKASVRDTEEVRKRMAAGGVWVRKNPKAPKERVSFTWNALLPWWIKWRILVEEFIRAKEAVKVGATEPLKSFINERLAESWEERFEEDKKPLEKGEYNMGDAWGVESQRFMTADIQKDHRWVVVRDWSETGESRLVWAGKLNNGEEMRAKQIQLDVTDRRVLVDSGFNTAEIYGECCSYGWVALKGEARDHYNIVKGDKTVRRMWAKPIRGDPGLGTHEQGRRFCPVILFATDAIKDILNRLKSGKGAAWGIPRDVSEEYLAQMDSETKQLSHGKINGAEKWTWVRIGNRANHLWDCEVMQVVAAVMAGILARSSAISEAESSDP
jgi:phage terminase large subunit GpA-like protein